MKIMKHPRMSVFLGLTVALAVLVVPASLTLVPPSQYPSRGACWGWHPVLVAMHDWGHAAMWVVYVAIPAMLFWIGWRTRAWRVAQAFPSLAIEGAAFILACAVTHLLARTEVYTATPWATGISILVAVFFGVLFVVDLVRKSQDVVGWLDDIAEAAELVKKLSRKPR